MPRTRVIVGVAAPGFDTNATAWLSRSVTAIDPATVPSVIVAAPGLLPAGIWIVFTVPAVSDAT